MKTAFSTKKAQEKSVFYLVKESYRCLYYTTGARAPPVEAPGSRFHELIESF